MNNNISRNYFCLDKVDIFAFLNNEQMNLIHNMIDHKFFKAGETIYIPGQKADSLYIVSSGKIRIFRLAENGKEQLLRIVISGEFTGELALFKEGYYEAFAEALEDVYVCSINHTKFKDLITKYPIIAIKMLEVLANRLSVSEQQTAWISTETVKDRLLHFLSRSATINLNNETVINLNYTKKDLASYLGTTPESLSRQWMILEDSGFIKHLNKNTYLLKNMDIELNTCKIL